MYDAIKLLVPDSSMPQELGNWNNIPVASEAFKWSNYRCLGEICMHEATLKLNNIPNTDAGSSDDFVWNVYIEGKKEGFNYFQIQTNLDYTGDTKNAFKDIIGKKDYKATLYKKSGAYAIYQFKIPGKNSIWLAMGTGNRNTGTSVIIVTGYLTLKAATESL